MKDKNVAAILAFFFGWMGGHKFYLGQPGAGLVYLLFSWTFIPSILGFIEFIILALMDKQEFDRRFNGSYTLGPNPVVVNVLPPANPYPPQQAYPPQGYAQQPQYGYPPQSPHAPHPGQMPQGYAPRPAQGQPVATAADRDNIVPRLEKLNELRIAGLLTDEEFATQKARILASV
jgi:TM2 domain-containing membrane protein YozV